MLKKGLIIIVAGLVIGAVSAIFKIPEMWTLVLIGALALWVLFYANNE